jgi:hypothetical protein
VREFINARVGIQTRDAEHEKSLSTLEEKKNEEKDKAVADAIVFRPARCRR